MRWLQPRPDLARNCEWFSMIAIIAAFPALVFRFDLLIEQRHAVPVLNWKNERIGCRPLHNLFSKEITPCLLDS